MKLYYGGWNDKRNVDDGQGNYGLANHHADKEDLLFTPLTKVRIDEMIYLTDLDKTYTYKIIKTETVKPTDVH